MKKVILIGISFIMMTSCRFPNAANKSLSDGQGIGDIKVKTERVFTAHEKKIIQSTCDYLAQKQDKFLLYEDMAMKFKFSVERSNCENDSISKFDLMTRLSNTSSTEMEYVADRTDYLRNVILDQTLGIKYLCDNLKSEKFNNFYEDSDYHFAYNVLIKEGFNRIEFIKSIKDSKGKWKAKSAEAIDFVSQNFQGNPKIMGMEYERTKNFLCDSGKFYYVKQSWVPANP